MSPFRALLKLAYDLGLRQLTFQVDLQAFVEGEGWAWVVQADGIAEEGGRTGDEALNRLVEKVGRR